MNTPDTTTRAEREQRDSRLYEFIRNGQRAEAMIGEHTTATRPGAPIDRERARQLAQLERRPAITAATLRRLVALADVVRGRAKARSRLYGLPADKADDIRAAIDWIDRMAAWAKEHR